MSYRMTVLQCSKCGWITARKKGETQGPFRCEACGEGNQTPFYEEQVVSMVMTIADQRSRKVQEHAEKHGFMVLKDSPMRYSVLRTRCPFSVTFKSNTARSYMELERVCGPVPYQQAMKCLLDHTPELPAYLTR